jgi:hypothetical protein
LSSEASRKLLDAVVAFHHSVNEVVRSDEGEKNHVRAILIQSVDLASISVRATADEPRAELNG